MALASKRFLQKMTPPARLLDVTRTLRRAGRQPTGVDRIERAYIKALLTDSAPVFALVRTRFGYILMDKGGLQRFFDQVVETSTVQMAERLARRQAMARSWPPGLGRLLSKHLPRGTSYFNVGHSNITERVLRATKGLGGTCLAFVHDVIPLVAPEWQREGTVDPFFHKIQLLQNHADVLVVNSAVTQKDLLEIMAPLGDAPKTLVAHLGVDQRVLHFNTDAAADIRLRSPYFVTIGTIEPRKNHAFLLDIWEKLGDEAPGLGIIGARGWKNEGVFARLDALPEDSPIQELGPLSDSAMMGALRNAAGLLFPSKMEGFGLPAVEAAALGVPVLCNDLPVFREILGNIPIYGPVSDEYLWISKINELVRDHVDGKSTRKFEPPTWAAHFETVLSLA